MTESKKAAKSVDVVLVGPSRGAQDGDKRSVDAETAELLVSAGTARYATKE